MPHATLPDGRFLAVAEDVTALAYPNSRTARDALTDPKGVAAEMLIAERRLRRSSEHCYTAARQAEIDVERRAAVAEAMAGETAVMNAIDHLSRDIRALESAAAKLRTLQSEMTAQLVIMGPGGDGQNALAAHGAPEAMATLIGAYDAAIGHLGDRWDAMQEPEPVQCVACGAWSPADALCCEGCGTRLDVGESVNAD